MSLAVVLAALLALSEGLAQIPSIKANSVFQLVFNILSSLKSLGGGASS